MRRVAVVIAVFATSALLATSVSAEPPGSKILSVTHPSGNPGLIDVEITGVEYDRGEGTIAISGTVRCNATGVFVLWVDYEASQTRGGTTTTGFATTSPVACDAPLHADLEAPSGGGFLPGKATISMSASACGRSSTSERIEAAVILIPE
jgi:hypothetical protein